MAIPGCVDLAGRSADQLEKEASAVEPGWFRAKVSDVYEKDGNIKLEFTLMDNRKHTETLWDPSASEAAVRLQQRRDVFAVRLGLVPREAAGTAYEFDWTDCIGRDCALELVKGKPNDKGQSYVQLSWVGVYPIDDSRVPANLRSGTPSAPQAVSVGAGGEKKERQSASRNNYDFSDL